MVEQENTIGKRLMCTESIPLGTANPGCDLCVWFEAGYQTSEGTLEQAAYATEILLHRRMFHIAMGDYPN